MEIPFNYNKLMNSKKKRVKEKVKNEGGNDKGPYRSGRRARGGN